MDETRINSCQYLRESSFTEMNSFGSGSGFSHSPTGHSSSNTTSLGFSGSSGGGSGGSSSALSGSSSGKHKIADVLTVQTFVCSSQYTTDGKS
ncbi:unnamed protein product [Protopolystoma xenopodis]|uniref:Uncharacterized protein n=1 Tax=Protopolystoma xenopodis TaxID=117903 RepID=A0A448WFV0_9PLAT|nr:unnamed protein product [Protopolystoma xenopodis]